MVDAVVDPPGDVLDARMLRAFLRRWRRGPQDDLCLRLAIKEVKQELAGMGEPEVVLGEALEPETTDEQDLLKADLAFLLRCRSNRVKPGRPWKPAVLLMAMALRRNRLKADADIAARQRTADREHAEAGMLGKMQARKPQLAVGDLPLFGSGR